MTSMTRQELVLEHLSDGKWHDGYYLCHPSIGGTEGLRRLRELRADGYPIEKRLKPNGPPTSRVYQYRLAPAYDATGTVPYPVKQPNHGG